MNYDRVVIDELVLNLNPLQTGGRASAEARKAAYRYTDGYAVCDRCEGVLHDIEKPDIRGFVAGLAEFLGLDRAAVTMGAREGKFAIIHSVANPGDPIVVDANAHYSTFMAAQRVGVEVIKTQETCYPEYRILPEDFATAIEQCKSKFGRPPALALLTHVDGNYGNLTDAVLIAKVCHEAGVPILLNAAYSAGRMPINARELGIDFLVGSGHKSFAATGPVGVMGAAGEWADRLFRVSPTHKNKNIELLGCTARGPNIVSFMAAFPGVKERVARWDAEVAKAQKFITAMESIGEIFQIGEKPHRHDLVRFETPRLDRIADSHRKRGYFLHSALTEYGITGLKPGQTKWFKMSTYGYSASQVDYIYNAFKEIAEAG
jgi:Sep-tRNA:Cys-tRNA synthetase